MFVVGVTQLAELNHSIVSTLCCQLFPRELQLSDEADFAYLDHLPEQWITEFWQYLARWFPDDLSSFEGLYLLPDGNEKLLRLDRNAAVIAVGFNDSTLPDAMIDICRHLGVRVIKEMLLSIRNRQDVWGRYILRPGAEGVLTALSRLDIKEMTQSFSSLSNSDRSLFRTYILSSAVAKPDVLCTGHNILRVLPMFEILPVISEENGTDSDSQMVSLEDVIVAGPVSSLPVNYPQPLLDANDPLLQQLLPRMKIKILSIPDCLTTFVFPAINDDLYSVEQVENLMKFVCDRWHTLCLDLSFASSVREVRFVARESGDLVVPSDLFDGDDPILRILFRGQDVFPVGMFASSHASIMRDVGLKGQKSVTASDVYAVIESLNHCSAAEVKTAETVVHFLEEHHELLLDNVLCQGCSLKEASKALRWVPFVRCRPSQYPQALRLCGENCDTILCTPDDVTSAKYCHLVGSVARIVDTAQIPKLAEIFRWNEDPGIENSERHITSSESDI